MSKLAPVLGLLVLLWLAPLAAGAGCRPGLAPNDARSCQAQRAQQARQRALRLVAEQRSAGPSMRAGARAGDGTAQRRQGALGGADVDASGRASDAAAELRATTAGEAGRARQREFQREQAERAARDTERSNALLERSRALRGGRILPRDTIGIGPRPH